MGEILEGKFLQILSKFVETNIKKREILCIYENLLVSYFGNLIWNSRFANICPGKVVKM